MFALSGLAKVVYVSLGKSNYERRTSKTGGRREIILEFSARVSSLDEGQFYKEVFLALPSEENFWYLSFLRAAWNKSPNCCKILSSDELETYSTALLVEICVQFGYQTGPNFYIDLRPSYGPLKTELLKLLNLMHNKPRRLKENAKIKSKKLRGSLRWAGLYIFWRDVAKKFRIRLDLTENFSWIWQFAPRDFRFLSASQPTINFGTVDNYAYMYNKRNEKLPGWYPINIFITFNGINARYHFKLTTHRIKKRRIDIWFKFNSPPSEIVTESNLLEEPICSLALDKSPVAIKKTLEEDNVTL